MTLAILLTVVVLAHDKSITATAITVLVLGSAVGAVAGTVTARRIAMTAMPQLVSVFNAVGGGAAALIALARRDRPRRIGAARPAAGLAPRWPRSSTCSSAG